jgi:drug/metabolite transporter (DMT)-like permease
MAAALQMMTGGMVLFGIAALIGEPARLNLTSIGPRAWAAFIYLIVVGSWAGFSAYAWMIRHASPAKVSTYAYVNPAVAVFLGWVCLGEPLTPSVLVSVGTIIAGVVLITLNGSVRWPSKAQRRIGAGQSTVDGERNLKTRPNVPVESEPS